MQTQPIPYVALGSRLMGLPEIRTLGVKVNFCDYTPQEQQLIFDAKIILYPTLNYAQFLTTMGKEIFPSLETDLYADDKVKQTTLFYMLSIPHPRTRFYYYRKCQSQILDDFSFPFVAKIPRASARGRGVFLITGVDELKAYLKRTNIAYIQKYLPHDRDLRVVLLNYQPIIAYWRYPAPGDFRTNLSRGGSLQFADLPEDGLALAREYSRKCRFNDVGLDLLKSEGKWYLIEANMKYGRKALKMKGMVLKNIIRDKLMTGNLFASDADL